MCGRLNQFAKLSALSIAGKALRIERRKSKKGEDKRAAANVIHNICPTDYADVMVAEAGEIQMERMRFGLVPTWAKGGKGEVSKKFALTFNARCETVFELASYRIPIMQRRCLIPVRGWHEWPDRKTPYFIHHSKDSPIFLAGIWDLWESRDPADEESGPLITSMSVITTPPGRYMAKFHDRSPLILEGEEALAWMQPGLSGEELRALIRPYDGSDLEAYRVSTAANQARNKTEEVFQPIADPVPQNGDAPMTGENSDLKLF